MIDPRLAHLAHSEPEKQHDDLEHVSKIAERALYPVIKLRSCAGCGGRFQGQDLFEVGNDNLTFSKAMSCVTRALRTTGYSSRYVAAMLPSTMRH